MMSPRKRDLSQSPLKVIEGGAARWGARDTPGAAEISGEDGSRAPEAGSGRGTAAVGRATAGAAGRATAGAAGRANPSLRPGAHLTDEEIIEAVQAGSAEIANELYHRLVDAVDITLYRIFGRREGDHEDLIQRSFEQIVITLSRRSYAGACSLRTWASAVTTRVAFNVLRSRRRERALMLTTAEDPTPSFRHGVDAEGQTLARAELQILRRHLSRMKSDRAQAVFLHDVLGHELAEIAVMENISVAAAQSRLVRGRKELYKRLGIDDAPGAPRRIRSVASPTPHPPGPDDGGSS